MFRERKKKKRKWWKGRKSSHSLSHVKPKDLPVCLSVRPHTPRTRKRELECESWSWALHCNILSTHMSTPLTQCVSQVWSVSVTMGKWHFSQCAPMECTVVLNLKHKFEIPKGDRRQANTPLGQGPSNVTCNQKSRHNTTHQYSTFNHFWRVLVFRGKRLDEKCVQWRQRRVLQRLFVVF